MEFLAEEVLLPPSPLAVLCAAAPTPLLEALALAVRAAAPPGGAAFASPTSAAASGGPPAAHAVQLRLEARQPAPQLYAPPRRRRAHGAEFYDSYVPSGILRNEWLSSECGAVRCGAVRCSAAGAARRGAVQRGAGRGGGGAASWVLACAPPPLPARPRPRPRRRLSLSPRLASPRPVPRR